MSYCHVHVDYKLYTYTYLNLNNLPFANVGDNAWLDIYRSHNIYYDINNLPSSNNHIFTDIDPDINNMIPNGLKNKCKGYDTSSEMSKDICFKNNITILHTNICSSNKTLKELMYYIDNLNINFTFIALSEPWPSKSNQDLLEILGYSHEQCISIK